jgi:hypothetical protein
LNKLVVHHTYLHGSTFDVSDNRNHGVPVDVVPGADPTIGFYSFGKGDSRIAVQSSPTLQNLYAIRVIVNFNLTAPPPSTGRANLIEGHLSFAVFINPDLSIEATILTPNGTWRGVRSAPSAVSPGRWHKAEFLHDGINTAKLQVDGVLVGSSYDARGPVRSIGPEGIAIGHWPGPDAGYTFNGNIGELLLYKYDPANDLARALNPCCIDKVALVALLGNVTKAGWDADKLYARGLEMLNLAIEIAAATRGSDPTQTAENQRNAAQLWAAFCSGDTQLYRQSLQRLADQMKRNLSPEQLLSFSQRAMKLVEDVPFSSQQVARSLCWEHGLVQVPQQQD